MMEQSSKNKVIFATRADHEIPSKYELPPPLPDERRPGIVLPNGEINWTCPCLGGLAYGPCGFEFREFFSCLHKNQEDEESMKAHECFPKFALMKDCMSQFPKLYPPTEDDDLADSTSKLQEEAGRQTQPSSEVESESNTKEIKN